MLFTPLLKCPISFFLRISDCCGQNFVFPEKLWRLQMKKSVVCQSPNELNETRLRIIRYLGQNWDERKEWGGLVSIVNCIARKGLFCSIYNLSTSFIIKLSKKKWNQLLGLVCTVKVECLGGGGISNPSFHFETFSSLSLQTIWRKPKQLCLFFRHFILRWFPKKILRWRVYFSFTVE